MLFEEFYITYQLCNFLKQNIQKQEKMQFKILQLTLTKRSSLSRSAEVCQMHLHAPNIDFFANLHALSSVNLKKKIFILPGVQTRFFIGSIDVFALSLTPEANESLKNNHVKLRMEDNIQDWLYFKVCWLTETTEVL